MILVGIPVGYATTNTLLDTGSMVAKGCKVGTCFCDLKWEECIR